MNLWIYGAGQDREGKKTTRTRTTRYITLLSVVLALALTAALAACGSDAPSTSSTSGTAAAPATEGAESESGPPQGSVATDREVLVAFYNAMDGDNWTNNTNWLSEAPLAEWHGVHTNSDGRVFNVRLTDNQLSGELPSELGSLTYLIILGTKDNQVSGEIPVGTCQPQLPGSPGTPRQSVERRDTA